MDNQEKNEYLIGELKAGRKISAIKFLRENDGVSLKDAKQQVEELQQKLIAAGEITESQKSKSGCGVLVLVCLLLIIASTLLWNRMF